MITPARLAWTADGTPYSAAYDDIYHSADGGLGQARHVFLGGNDLLGMDARWRGRERFVIVETGFGLGLNFLATWQAWRDDAMRCARLHFISFEKHPFNAADLAQLHARWPELAECAAALRQQWPALLPGAHRLFFDDGRVVLTLFFGDATELLPKLRARADAFYLDGFAPDRNPDLWTPRIYSSLARIAVTGATLATWTVAGAVRKALADTGFVIEKTPGFGGKREMTRGVFRVARTEAASPAERHAIVIGAGLAGCATAERLAARGWRVTLIERAAGPAQGASGNPVGLLRPLPSIDDNLLARLTRAGFLHARRHLRQLEAENLPVRWRDCGVLHLAREAMHEAAQRRIVDTHLPPQEYLRWVDRDEASRLAGWPVRHGGWWFSGAGWVAPPSLCRANLERCGERIRSLYDCEIARITYSGDTWSTFDADGRTIASAPVLVLASAGNARRLLEQDIGISLPLRGARGQISLFPADALRMNDIAVCSLGYLTPPMDGWRSTGATFIADDTGADLRAAEHRENLARIELALPGIAAHIEAASGAAGSEGLQGRVGIRSITPDRLPLVGALPLDHPDTRLDDIPRLPGLWGMLGLGARGLVWASLAAELLVSQIEGDPLPLEGDLVAALDPARFLLRQARRSDSPDPSPDAE